ncbi:bifunctional 4-hydroxy-2-oxoglutarate aldolase/2-dehydro-3-deoxy-phosphogluconate aldolase [Idiomarina aquatica]|uniref:Keto-deoxy-phosphogluconate aldolase n=1 Tax=Idiomarina aquatica TaxID=1327752 RepID=A0AA94JCY4_9GAMM|nr:bifunctional 4-hydroxy-2-oxoglutarate aldolase/2-dehydro-3-deoxy-phosphogluconate aldolase [Idiomarina aquatica]RUO43402.1 keto-deoxy-phosphogluconate aldolase [Idiomarina aquatica]
MTLTAKDIFARATIIPVMTVDNVESAVELGRKLYKQGFEVLEVTLRTSAAIHAIEEMRRELPHALVGAGTVLNDEQLQSVIAAGAQFAISPGATDALLKAGAAADIPLIPGVATVSEAMNGMQYGYTEFKLFPAEAVGGVKLLKAISAPLADITFCPTGGINEANYKDYLALPNVACVGGSWII